jgi:demethylmenaquinone methyltransferase/2-methoxy-6-polyprenyl-1,4-benzoquinol methylase
MTSARAHDESLSRFATGLFDHAAPGYDAIAQLLSYGQYRRWQNTLIRAAVRHGVDARSTVLDAATGTAGVARQLAHMTHCRIVGVDQSSGMLAAARSKLLDGSTGTALHIQLIEGSALDLPFPNGVFDAVLFTYLFRYVEDPAVAMRELVRVARPGALIGFIEFHVPAPPWKPLWLVHTRIVLPVAGRLISPGWYQVGRFLGPSIERFYDTWSIPALGDMLRGAGLKDVDHRLMSLGGGLIMWGVKKEMS